MDKNIQAIAALFPNALTEVMRDGKTEYAIDFDVLRQELSNVVVEGAEERYQFTWPDKKQSVLRANAPNYKTLRPCREESVNFDTTENLYIEGDNLDVLKLLQETYLGKVKMIYIDPPYNTGKDFIYPDKFNTENWDEVSGEYDEDGYRMVQNLESNGQYHTDWLNIMYPRLRLAKDLLSSDGAIFVSIGQNEIANLVKIMNEIFGTENQIGLCSRQMKTGSNQGKHFAPNIDYVIVYAKNTDECKQFSDELSDDLIQKVYNKVQESGSRKGQKYRTMGLFQTSLKHGGSRYPIECPDGSFAITPEGFPWRWNEATFLERKENDEIVFLKTNTSPLVDPQTGKSSNWNIYTKIWLDDRMEACQLPKDIILGIENRHAAKELNEMGIFFDFPKPINLIKWLIKITQQTNSIILDFFSGSATTAHAVMQLNAEDGGNRKFIMVQIPEVISEKHEAYKAGYRTICDIGKERIRRAGARISKQLKLDENNSSLLTTLSSLDIGFRVLKVDSTNMKDVYYCPEEVEQNLLDTLTDNIKEDRTPEDLLFQVMLDLGVFLSCKIDVETIGGKQVYMVYQGDIPYLIACFDDSINSEVVTAIAKMKPYYAVFRDSSMESDSLMTSFEQIFEAYSKTTIRRVL